MPTFWAVPRLHALVEYEGELRGWEPAGLALVEYTQGNPTLDAHRAVLEAAFPRRKFETELCITVGGLRADSGSYFIGRDRGHGLSKLATLQETHKLGLVGGQHIITKTFDPDDHRRDEGTSVSIEARFTRPQWPEATPIASVSVHADGPFGAEHLDSLVTAAWQSFRHLVGVAPITKAYADWDSQSGAYHPPTDGPAVHAFMLLDARTVAGLGGSDAAIDRLGVIDWQSMNGDEANGLVVQLSRRPDDWTYDRVKDIRGQLAAL